MPKVILSAKPTIHDFWHWAPLPSSGHYYPVSGRSSPFSLILSISLILFCCADSACSRPDSPGAAPPPVPVVTSAAILRDLPVEIHAIGNVQARVTVGIKSQVSAQLKEVLFKEGDEVRRGQLLFRLDDRQLLASFEQIKASLKKEQAQLTRAQTVAARYTELYKSGIISKDAYDEAKAQAEALKASTDAARAAVEEQRVQLTYTDIYSPCDGKTGVLLVAPGNQVKANDDSPLVVINQIEPIYVEFSVPEGEFPEVKKHLASGPLPVFVSMPHQGPSQESRGYVSFIDNSIDRGTGTIRLRGVFANRDRRLWPGEQLDVLLRLSIQKQALVVPSQAVMSGQQGEYVYVVNHEKRAENRTIHVQRTQGAYSVISTGLHPGELVVTDGQVSLEPNRLVEVKRAPDATADTNVGY
ncbi:MAG: efflux RND transporter periplasmic adaptor subunit [Terriglobia bacterium]|nr:efflux RND transporter periplasmic adaptor subunit [Terriglobia bacterium]